MDPGCSVSYLRGGCIEHIGDNPVSLWHVAGALCVLYGS